MTPWRKWATPKETADLEAIQASRLELAEEKLRVQRDRKALKRLYNLIRKRAASRRLRASKPKPQRETQPKREKIARVCMRCEKPFPSAGDHNRMCRTCR